MVKPPLGTDSAFRDCEQRLWLLGKLYVISNLKCVESLREASQGTLSLKLINDENGQLS